MSDEEVTDVVTRLKASGVVLKEKKPLPNGSGVQLKFAGGEIVSIFDTGTVLVQGKNQEHVRKALGMADGKKSGPAVRAGAGLSNKVFVAYGHDMAARTELEAMLLRWGLEPLILDQLPSEGHTIIEKLEKYAGGDIGFAVVLATPDDEGFKRGKPEEKRFRARQNVVLELGLLLSRLGRSKVAILFKDKASLEAPSDIHGLIYLPFIASVEEVKLQLGKEMAKQGYEIDVKKL